jgi:GTP:adenosylcobinamide-phosphate guanylyltransferase
MSKALRKIPCDIVIPAGGKATRTEPEKTLLMVRAPNLNFVAAPGAAAHAKDKVRISLEIHTPS